MARFNVITGLKFLAKGFGLQILNTAGVFEGDLLR